MVDFLTEQEAHAHTDAYRVERGHYYRSETKYLSQLVGHEIAPDQRDFHRAVAYINRASKLGMDAQDEAVMGHMLTALSLQSRFVGDPTMPLRRGENPASHSLQCINMMERLFALLPAGSDEAQLAQLRQFVGLTLMIHDMGEVLGEAAGVQHSGVVFEDGFSKEALERTVLEHVLSLAIAQEESALPKGYFAQQVAQLTASLDIAGRAERQESLTQQEVDAALAAHPVPPLSEAGRQRLTQWMALWEMAEQPEKTDTSRADVALPQHPAFVGNLIKSIEHTQGTRHLIRFALKENESEGKLPLHTVQLKHMLRNFNYVEGELGALYSLAQAPLEKTLSQLQRDQVYAVCQSYIDEVLSATKRDAASQQHGTPEAVKPYLEKLERMMGMYEAAVYQDIHPVAGERSIGAPYLQALLEPQHAPSLPQAAIASETIAYERRALSATGRSAA